MRSAFLDLILPGRCAGCGAPGAVLCAGCEGAVCGRAALRMPTPVPAGLPPCWSAGAYSGVARRAIIAYKERGRTAVAAHLARTMAGTLAEAWCAQSGQAPAGPRPGARWFTLVPVPSSRSARHRRGHDPVRVLAALAARHLQDAGWPVAVAAILRPRRPLADQAGLSASERAANLSSAYRVTDASTVVRRRVLALSQVLSRPVVLVDDIITTGATLAEAARALRAAGAAVPLAVTVAATSRRTRPETAVRPRMVHGRGSSSVPGGSTGRGDTPGR